MLNALQSACAADPNELELSLHRLAERLWSATNYIDAIRESSGGRVRLLESAARELNLTANEFRMLRDVVHRANKSSAE